MPSDNTMWFIVFVSSSLLLVGIISVSWPKIRKFLIARHMWWGQRIVPTKPGIKITGNKVFIPALNRLITLSVLYEDYQTVVLTPGETVTLALPPENETWTVCGIQTVFNKGQRMREGTIEYLRPHGSTGSRWPVSALAPPEMGNTNQIAKTIDLVRNDYKRQVQQWFESVSSWFSWTDTSTQLFLEDYKLVQRALNTLHSLLKYYAQLEGFYIFVIPDELVPSDGARTLTLHDAEEPVTVTLFYIKKVPLVA